MNYLNGSTYNQRVRESELMTERESVRGRERDRERLNGKYGQTIGTKRSRMAGRRRPIDSGDL